jgi:hypothetical protein
LAITKSVTGPGAPATWSFDFTGDLGPFMLDDRFSMTTFFSVTPGTYTISETAVAGFEASVECSNGDSSPNGTLTVTLNPGETVVCTFTNSTVVTPTGSSILLPVIIR